VGLRAGKIVRDLGFLLLIQGAAIAQQVNFIDATETMKAWGWRITKDGVRVSAYGHGASFADVSGDSIPDLYISSAKRKANGEIPETLYIGQPGGAAYSEEDGKRGCSDSYGMTGTHGISLFDYDNDGDFDIYNATTDDRNRLYRNTAGYFTDVSDSVNLKAILVPIDTYGPIGYGTRGVVAFDAENDGYMDLLGVNWGPVENAKEVPWITPAQPNEFYHNNGDGTFSKDDTRGLTLPYNPSYEGTQGVTAADVNNDGWMDIFICHRNYAYLGKDESGNDLFGPGTIPCPNQLMINDGTGHFVDETNERGLYDASNDINGATFADFDNDGDLDLFIPPKDIFVRRLKIYKNDGNGYFTDISNTIKIEQWGFSSIFGDFNNDGFLDLFASRSYGTSSIYLNTGTGNFTQQATAGVEASAYDPRGGAVADIEGDGDLDIYYVDANKDGVAKYSNRLYKNITSTTNRWLKVTGRGPKGDAGGFGSKIWVFEAGSMDDMAKLVGYRQVMNTYGYLCQDDPVQHFGVGSRTAVDVKVRLLDGTELKMNNVAANRKIVFTRPQQLALFSGDQQSGSGGQPLANPLKVKVTDTWGHPVRGAAVHWSVLLGGGSVSAPVSYTGADGIASTTCTLGTAVARQQVQASSPDFSTTVLFTLNNNTPMQAQIARVSGSGQAAEAAALLPLPLVARVSSLSGAPISQFGVVFKVIAGGGKVNAADSVTVLSDGNGMVQVSWQLGAQAGSAQQVKAYLPGLAGQIIYFDGMTFGAASALQWLSPLSHNGTAGKPLADSLTAKVVDSSQHPISNYPVDFSVTAGGGQVNGAATVRVLTNSQGIAKCQWRLGPQAGSSNQILRATAVALQNSPVTVTASAAAAAPYQLAMLSGDAQTAMIGELFSAPLTVTVSDTFGNPVSGQIVLFQLVQGSAYLNNAASATVSTAADGRAQAMLKAGAAAGPVSVQVSAAQAGSGLVNSPLTFTATVRSLPFDPAKSSLTATSPVIANNRSQSSITVQLRDASGNPVTGSQVTLQASGSNNSIRQPAATNALGQATGYLLSTRAEVKKVWATIDGSLVSVDSARVTFISGPGAELAMVSGNDQTAYIGRTLAAPLVVSLADSFENPVAGAAITATMQKPDGSRLELTAQSTDARGYANFQPALSLQPGEHTFTLRSGTTAAVIFTAQALTALPADLIKISGDEQVGLPGRNLPLPLCVQVVDQGNLPLPNCTVTFSFITGSGTFPNGATALSGSDGKASVIVQPGAVIGQYYIAAQVSGLEKNVTFSATTRQARAASLEIIDGDQQSARPGSTLPRPLTIRVVDELQQPAGGIQVLFAVVSGAGSIQPGSVQYTGTDGMASAAWTLGSSGSQSVKAWLVETPTLQTVFNATLTANQAPVMTCTADTTVAEGGTLSLWVKVVDPEGDPIHLSALDMPPTAGLDPLSGIFSWNPGYSESGLYKITFMAVDNLGASSSRSCRIHVTDVRRPLQVLTYAPAETLVVMDLYRPYTFEVTAFDPDGDSLRYQWEFNGLPVGNKSILKVTANPTFPARSRVSVRIFTPYASTTFAWTLEIQTGVATRENDPASFALEQNYPNPFNPVTHIPFQLGRAAHVEISLYNGSGRLVRRLYDDIAGSGWHQIVWDGRDEDGEPVPSGTYYCRMHSESFQQIKKLLLLK
jgi:hypothetical protein